VYTANSFGKPSLYNQNEMKKKKRSIVLSKKYVKLHEI